MEDQNGRATRMPRHFCVEDLVQLKNNATSVGIVDRTFGDIDSHEPGPQQEYAHVIQRHKDIPSDQFEEFLRTGVPPRGTVLVSWRSHNIELIREERLNLVDRKLYVGDLVKRRLEDPMSGVVIGSKVTCSVLPIAKITGTTAEPGAAIHGVPADELINIHELNEGSLVIYKDWLGKIQEVYDDVAVRLEDNSVVVVENPDELDGAEDIFNPRISVGQRVKAKKANLRRGQWKYGSYNPNVRPEGTVVETRTVSVGVQWLAQRLGGNTGNPLTRAEPPSLLGLDELESPEFHVYDASAAVSSTLPLLKDGMRSYHVADINAGERVRFKDITAASMKYNGNPPRYKGYPQGRLERIPRTETLGYDMNVFTVVATETEVTVRWQDLTVTECSGRDLVPDSTVVDIGDAWPGEVICTNEERKDIPEDERWAFQPAKVGVIQSVQPRDRIASVRWYENPEIRLLDSDLIPPTRTGKLQANTEEISLYDIRVFGLTRHRGDFVMIHPDAIRETEDGEPDTGSSDAEWFGEIVDLGLDGKLTVRLGVASPVRDVRVAPETVSFVYNDDDDALDDATNPFDEVTDFSYDTSDEWEGHMDNMWVEYQEGMGGVLADDADEDEWSTEDEDEENEDHNGKGTSETTPVNEEDAEMHEAPNTDASTATATPQPLAQNSSIRKENDTTTPAHIPETSIDFDADILSPFMILDTSPPSNHHFYFQNPGSSPSFLKRISKEHKILRSSLPQGIFVRTWESHLNLLRVLVIGPADTPYEYAPFVIDLCVDSSYPSSPPLAYFHSWTNGQGPINPNLYEDGKICLSLLGTWHTDEHNESWSSKSTLLQVLISIHSLVLNKDPYYNEAGFDVHRQTPETRLSSALYTERAYFRARAFITHALTNDIQPFEQELKELYLSQRPGAPQLLAKAISSAKEVIARSEKDDGEERDGLKRISRGALVPLKRQVEKLEELTKSN